MRRWPSGSSTPESSDRCPHKEGDSRPIRHDQRQKSRFSRLDPIFLGFCPMASHEPWRRYIWGFVILTAQPMVLWWALAPPHPVPATPEIPHLGSFSQKKDLHGNSLHGITRSSADEINDRPQRSEQKQKTAGSYRHLQRQKKEIRRASEQTSPQVACAVGHPAMGRGRRIEQWQLARSAAFVSAARMRPD